MDAKDKISQFVEESGPVVSGVADRVWDLAEVRFKTDKSADEYEKVLRDNGFTVRRGAAGMNNVLIASYGEGKPVIGILAEYDALPNMNQTADLARQQQDKPGAAGHACGHNILGAGALAGVLAVKKLMEEESIKGTIRFYGCPAEESGYGKAFMTRAGLFDDCGAILAWHPSDAAGVASRASIGVAQMYFKFTGIPAHAAGAPELGRSALDAAELMNVGVNFLREHMIREARIHYAFIDAGGTAANVVQPTACLYYFVRAPYNDQILDLCNRVVKCAKGAAMMTETSVDVQWDSAICCYVPNQTLNQVIYKNLQKFADLHLTDAERLYEQKYYDTISAQAKASLLTRTQKSFPDKREEEQERIAAEPILEELMPMEPATMDMGGGGTSTDVGDPSWKVPTAKFTIGCEPQGTAVHSWQWCANGKSSVAHKAALAAGKVFAATAYDLFMDPDLIRKADADRLRMLNGKTYHSLIPDDVKPGQ